MEKGPIKCIGFILDGNRRWAKQHNIPTIQGHRRGAQNLQAISKAVHKMGIENMVCYAFSTQNWNRSEQQVTYLMTLFKQKLKEYVARMGPKVACWVCGDMTLLPKQLIQDIQFIHSSNPQSPELSVYLLISYGSRREIIEAVNKAIEAGVPVTQSTFGSMLQTTSRGMPDPQLIVRTGGQSRLSNFLMWQAVYSQLIFLDRYWPQFTETDLANCLQVYHTRKRRLGK